MSQWCFTTKKAGAFDAGLYNTKLYHFKYKHLRYCYYEQSCN